MTSDTFRFAARIATKAEIEKLTGIIRAALEGDSNDAEHDALVDVAQFFGIGYDPDAAS